MKKKLVIFGDGDIAELAWYYFTYDSQYEVVGFVVDDEYITKSTLFDLPVTAFSTLVEKFPKHTHSAFIALSYSRMNFLRQEKYCLLKDIGYEIASYVSSKCTNYAKSIGENCFILEDNTLQPFVTIGNNVTLWSGNHIGHHSTIDDHSFLASQIVVSGGVKIESNCFVGVNATIRDHITIATRTLIGMGAIISRDTEVGSVYKTSGTRPTAGLQSSDVPL